ncbi:MAG: carboxy-S-adenosyl-L-methionine synthase CmoA [Cyanobacteria bacterium P01_H01_bin.121]
MSDIQLRLYPKQDAIYTRTDSAVAEPFRFNEEVSEVFDDMAVRSIPLYKELLQLALTWSLAFYRPGTYLYDLGCSTGTFLELFCRHVQTPARLIAVDSSEAMLQRSRTKVAELPTAIQIEFVQQRLQDVVFQPASVMVLNYTLQFLPISDRLAVLSRAAQQLLPGGILILSEKLRLQDAGWHELATANYEQFKQQNGYSRREIERKKEALERVLIPLSLPEQIQMLQEAGFRRFQTLLAWQQFTTLVASV